MDTYPNIWNFWYRGIMYGLLLGALLGALYGGVAGLFMGSLLIGTLYGVILGGGAGLLLGIPSGIVNWYVTRLAYPRLIHEQYRVVLALCSGLLSGVCTFLAYSLLFQHYVWLPAIIAAVAGIWAAGRIASWYIQADMHTV